MGIEPTVRVLQTLALPLGDVAVSLETKADAASQSHQPLFRAGDGIRTRDLLLGKETLYH